jgi:hypothetical protein
MNEDEYQKLEAELLALDDVALALQIVLIRSMLSHRAIGVKDIALELNCTPRWVRAMLKGNAYDTRDKNINALDSIESAITVITDQRGGIPEACCGEAIDSYRAILRKERYGPKEVLATRRKLSFAVPKL